jgi:hypothetical protein
MKNMVVLQKNKEGQIHCKQISEVGKEFHLDSDGETTDMWEDGGTILLDELEEILDREV